MIYRSPYPDVDIPNVTLPEFLFEHAAKYTDKAALIDGPTGRAVTYGRRRTEMDTQQTMITTIPYQQKDAGAQEAIKLFALYLQGITLAQVTR